MVSTKVLASTALLILAALTPAYGKLTCRISFDRFADDQCMVPVQSGIMMDDGVCENIMGGSFDFYTYGIVASDFRPKNDFHACEFSIYKKPGCFEASRILEASNKTSSFIDDMYGCHTAVVEGGAKSVSLTCPNGRMQNSAWGKSQA